MLNKLKKEFSEFVEERCWDASEDGGEEYVVINRKELEEKSCYLIGKAYEGGCDEWRKRCKEEKILTAEAGEQMTKILLKKQIEEIKKRLPEESHCELCDYPQPECSCRGFNAYRTKTLKILNTK